jgi:FixJ family two-component response regulator
MDDKISGHRSQSLSSYTFVQSKHVAVAPRLDKKEPSRTISVAPRSARSCRSCQVPNHQSIVAIVDDDQAVGNAIEVLMRSIGLVAQAFSSGEEFLCSPELSRISCLVVDFDMPKMNGLDLHNNLSRLGKEIPTIMITAYPSDDIRARALQAGVICYLPKPFDENSLLNCIQTALNRAKGNRSAP